MEQEEIKKLCEERDITYKGDFIESLTEEEFKSGTAKLNLTAPDGGDVDGIWCWITPEDREKYDDDNFYGDIKSKNYIKNMLLPIIKRDREEKTWND